MIRNFRICAGDRFAGDQVLGLEINAICCEELYLVLGVGGAVAQFRQLARDLAILTYREVDVIALLVKRLGPETVYLSKIPTNSDSFICICIT